VDSSVLRELQSVILRTLLFLNEKWSDFHLVKFLSGSSCFEVFGQKIHLIPLLKLRRHFAFILEVGRSPFLCGLDLVSISIMNVF